MSSPQQNPVGYLQEFTQKHNVGKFPTYTELAAVGQDHCKSFSCKCEFLHYEVSASATLKKAAKTEAARMMVAKLNEEKFFDKYNVHVADNIAKANSPIPFQLKSPISRLQEHCQAQKSALPAYNESNEAGVGFVYECKVAEDRAVGRGTTKKSAKEDSAFKMCVKLGILEAGAMTISEAEHLYRFQNESENASATGNSNSANVTAVKSPISALQELCQRNGKPTPVYVEKGLLFDTHIVECSVGEAKGLGRNISKKGAKAEAAYECLKVVMQSMPSYIAGLVDPEMSALEAAVTSNRPDPLEEWVEPNANGGGDEEKKPAAHWLQDDVEVEPSLVDPEMSALEAAAEQLTLGCNRPDPLEEWVEPNVNGGGDEEQKPAAHWLQDSVVEVEPRSDENLSEDPYRALSEDKMQKSEEKRLSESGSHHVSPRHHQSRISEVLLGWVKMD